ncbi:ABC transporter permease [Roseovarius sp. EL26]|uniref:ABC transporter permease n=1 Tax=Roseovarius sp. EL26 TaxID=2126672 RepID=UPI000EA222D6|nr:ABC transporter permease subunit [Roseovarius sp. EL26]
MNPIELLIQYWPKYLEGLWVTIQLAGIGAILAAIIAPGLALVRLNGPAMFSVPVRVYVSFIRGTPMLAQLFLIYYGSGQFRPFLQDWGLWSLFREPYNCAMLTFVISSTAYQIEILRGGLMGVPYGEIEAAKAVGMSPITRYRRVIFPHAYRIAWPALGNEVILLVKASALASVVTIFDLLGETRLIFSKTFDLSAYLWAALLYLALTAVLVWVWCRAEILLNPQFFKSDRV